METVFLAFGSPGLAAEILAWDGAVEGIILVRETRLVPELAPPGGRGRVLVMLTHDEYRDAMNLAPDFPWAEHIIEYHYCPVNENPIRRKRK